MEYIFTERAHLMCPNMCFGIVASVNKSFDRNLVEKTVEKLSTAHPFLRALIACDEKANAYFYDVTDESKVEVIFAGKLGVGTSCVESNEIISKYKSLVASDWNLFDGGLLKIVAWDAGDKSAFLLVFHHLLADGRGALGLAQELADFYVHGKEPKEAVERLITKKDLPEDSKLPFLSRSLVNSANRKWRKENHTVSYQDYHAFADDFLKTDSVNYTLVSVNQDELSALHSRCKSQGVSINDYLLAKMFLEDKTERVIIACDLRDKLACYNPGSLGNYSTAFSVELKKSCGDVFENAKRVHSIVRKKLNLPRDLYLVLQCYASLEGGLLDASLISSRGGFESKAAKFIGTMFFNYGKANGYSITNLGKIESESLEAAYFIPPASPAVRKTQGVLTVNGTMRICTAER